MMLTRVRRRAVPIILGTALVAGGLTAAPATAAAHHAAPAATRIAACAPEATEFADWWTSEGWPRTGSNEEYQTTDPDNGDTVWIWGGETYRNDSDPQLPSGTYNSYDADFLTSQDENRGADRLVRDANTHETYYTDDHYASWCDMGAVG